MIPAVHPLRQEVECILAMAALDDRKPLPRQAFPMFDIPPDAEETTRDLVLAELADGHEMSLGHIAARILRREEEVGRSLLVLRMAGDVDIVREAAVVAIGKVDRSTSVWRMAA